VLSIGQKFAFIPVVAYLKFMSRSIAIPAHNGFFFNLVKAKSLLKSRIFSQRAIYYGVASDMISWHLRMTTAIVIW